MKSADSRLPGPEFELAKIKTTRPWFWIATTIIFAVTTAAATWFAFNRPLAPKTQFNSRPISSENGTQSLPSISPDGESVAFAWTGEDGGNTDIYIRKIGPGAPVRLTSDPGVDTSPSWSPDGNLIAYERRSSPLWPGAPIKNELRVISLDGKSDRLIASGALPSAEPVRCMSWSADGKTLYWARAESTGQLSIVKVNLADGEAKVLTKPETPTFRGDMGPSISPDGRKLLFTRFTYPATGELYLLPLDGKQEPEGEPRRITSLRGLARDAVWTNDGRIVFTLQRGIGSTLWTMTPGSNAEPEQMSNTGDAPTLSAPRDPRTPIRLVYREMRRREHVWRWNPGEQAVPFIHSSRRDYEARFSPDGTRIAFSSDRTGNVQVWTSRPDGRGALQLTDFPGVLTAGARWSPDGKKLVFLTNFEGQQDIYTIPSTGGAATPIVKHPSQETSPSWSRDGEWIYFASTRTGRSEVWKVRSTGGEPLQLTTGGGVGPMEAPDGSAVYFIISNSRGIWKTGLNGGKPEQIIPAVLNWGSYDITKDGIYYVPPDGKTIQFYEFGTGRIREMLKIPERIGFGISAGPNGSLLFSQIEQEDSELVMVENFR